MGMTVKQGMGESLTLTLPFSTELLSDFTLDLFQSGEKVVTKAASACTASGATITAALSASETALLSPQRGCLSLKGTYAAGGTVIIDDIPFTVYRSSYRG